MDYPAAAGGTIRRSIPTYDLASRLQSLTYNGTAMATSPVYNASSQTTQLNIGSALQEQYTFDPKTGLLTNQKVVQGATTHMDLSYDYGNLYAGGNATWKTGQLSKIIDNKITNGNRNREYNYDKLGRLTQVKGGPNGGLWNQTYSYDWWGNRTGITQTGTSGAGGAFIPMDGLASLSYNTTTNRITTGSFAYDAAGNQTQANENGLVNNYKYDAAGRLAEVSNSIGLHTYAYGASNQRLQMVEDGTNGGTTLYVWEGGSVIAEYNGVGSGMAWTKSYVYLGGRLLATDSTSGIQYHHPDRLGTRLATNTSGGVVSENIGLPFGNTITGESNNLAGSASKKRFTSYDRSDNTKLDYAVNRHYSAAQGRFTQVDPIGMNAAYLTNPQSLNLYAYCFNDPINHTDPDGLDTERGGANGNLIVAIIMAVVGALRVLFGGRQAAAKMGARIERRLPPNETGSSGRRARPTVRAGSGAVEDFIFYQTQPTDPPDIIDLSDVVVLTIETWDYGPLWENAANLAHQIVVAGLDTAARRSAGFGDTLTTVPFTGGWNLTSWARKNLPFCQTSERDESYLKDSWDYTLGQVGGTGMTVALGYGAVARPLTASEQVITHWNTAENIATGSIRAGSWVMTGGGTIRNYLFMGKPYAYSFGNRITQTVPGSALKWPSGIDKWKGFIGHRKYCPK